MAPVPWAWPFWYYGSPSYVGGVEFSIWLSEGAGTALAGTAYGTDPYGDTATGVNGSTDVGVGVWGQAGAGNGVLGQSTGSDAVVGQSWSASNAGIVGQNYAGGYGVWASAKTGGHFETDGTDGAIALEAFGNVNVNGALWANPSMGDAILAFAQPGANAIAAYNPGGTAIATLGDITVSGNHTVTGTATAYVDVVVGSDCAEDFDIACLSEVEPGTVMVLTDTGALEPSQSAYDKKVAGVISGAGDCQPGLILGRDERSQNRMPLALTGRVYCKVDAQFGPIQVGDLLTTSPTRGHAMRASDPLEAFGAVIGKSLRRFDSGQGLIPILVGLR